MIAEFRQTTWPHRIRDYEHLIEHFDPASVDLASLSPAFYTLHTSIKEEEDKLIISQLESQLEKDETSLGEEQQRIEKVLYNLFFTTPNTLVSPDVEFDATIRFVVYVSSVDYIPYKGSNNV